MVVSHEETKELVEQAFNLACKKFAEQKYEQTVVILDQALKVDPKNANILQILGLAYHALKNNEKAREHLFASLLIEPNNSETLNNIGLSYSNTYDYDKSIDYINKAICLKPENPSLYSNLGLQYRHLQQYEKAIECFNKSLSLREDATAYAMLGGCYGEMKNLQKAKEMIYKALKINPNFAAAHVDLASILQLEGNWTEGFNEYEWRYTVYDQLKQWERIYDPIKKWKGQNIQNKIIIVHTEQGHGDAIHFSRYLSNLKYLKPKKIILHCGKSLERLFEEMANFIFTIDPVQLPEYKNAKDNLIPEHDYHCSILSLPYLLGFPPVPATPYLFSKKKFDMSNYKNDYKIGIVWAGNPQHSQDRWRSCKLEMFKEISQISGVKLFSLMKDTRSRAYVTQNQPIDLSENTEDMKIVDMSSYMEDFQSTADIISSLDLIIGVDTSVIHLAGALDKPTIALIAWNCDWRWTIDGDKSIWYRSLKLVRQTKKGEWDDVFEKAKQEVLKLVK